MEREGLLDKTYHVNGVTIFDRTEKGLEIIFNDFPNKRKVVDLVLNLNGFFS